tara:strand:+ start:194 stop:1123 length:930 start_codon:yes stop_codon:yes gene_type:complete
MKNFISKFIFSPPLHTHNILILNILGYQIIRIVIIHLKFYLLKIFFLKDELVDYNTTSLKDNGYTIINDFLNFNDFKEIKLILEKLKEKNHFKNEKYGQVDVLLGPVAEKNEQSQNKILEKFQESKLKIYIESVIKKKITELPSPVFQEITLNNKNIDEDDTNSEFHVDRHFPCCKAFYYLSANTINNGAFVYISKSHKLTLHRLKFEYLHSIFNRSNLFNRYLDFFGFVKKNNRLTLRDDILKKYFGEAVICEAPENSLVICNNMGFHKRGKLIQHTLSRKHLRFNFYDMQLNSVLRNIKFFIRKHTN